MRKSVESSRRVVVDGLGQGPRREPRWLREALPHDPEELSSRDLRRANELARDWMEEVNAAEHSEIAAVPSERLAVELELLGSLPQLRANKPSSVTPNERPGQSPRSPITVELGREHDRICRPPHPGWVDKVRIQ
jgi:hypothetical protein